jgi:hypothetical protein
MLKKKKKKLVTCIIDLCNKTGKEIVATRFVGLNLMIIQGEKNSLNVLSIMYKLSSGWFAIGQLHQL